MTKTGKSVIIKKKKTSKNDKMSMDGKKPVQQSRPMSKTVISQSQYEKNQQSNDEPELKILLDCNLNLRWDGESQMYVYERLDEDQMGLNQFTTAHL
ncbi:hypothetical protein Tco_1271575 [Tanacetum coccineum]